MIKFSSSDTPTITPLVDLPKLTAPQVYYSTQALATIQHLVARAKGEVAWLGTVTELGDGNYRIEEIFIPEQEVSPTTAEIDASAMSKLTMQLMDRNIDPGTLRYHGHSHVDMGVSPSSTDQNHIADYLEHADYFLREIRNKRGASRMDVFDKRLGVVFQCVTTTLYDLLQTKDFWDTLDATMAANVKAPARIATPTQYQYGKGHAPVGYADNRALSDYTNRAFGRAEFPKDAVALASARRTRTLDDFDDFNDEDDLALFRAARNLNRR
jgi:hypothetical protein